MPRWIAAAALATCALAATTFAWLPISAIPSVTSPTTLEDGLLRHATLVWQHAVDPRAPAIPGAVLLRATAVAVFPHATRTGSRYFGKGIVSARSANPSNWTPPAVIALRGTIPLELESDAVDFVLVAQTQRGVDWLIQPHFVSPVILPIVPGALGHDTRVRLDADLLAYMHFAGYFAGITIRDWAVQEDREANSRLYGRPYSTDDIVGGAGFFHLPQTARSWLGAIAASFRDMS